MVIDNSAAAFVAACAFAAAAECVDCRLSFIDSVLLALTVESGLDMLRAEQSQVCT